MQKLVWQNANGVELDLTSGNYGITEWEGFSNASLNVQTQTVPFQDGAVFLDALVEQRELSVTLAMQDNNNLELRYQQRREIISALNPKLGEGYLIYTNDFISKRIKCVPQIPLFETHNSDTAGTPKASLSWTACNPYWEDLEETEITLSDGQIFTIQNEGDIFVGIEVEIEYSNNDVKLSNITTGQEIQVETAGAGNLYLSTEAGNKVVEKVLNQIDNKMLSMAHFCNGRNNDIVIRTTELWLVISNYTKINTIVPTSDITPYPELDITYISEVDKYYISSITNYLVYSQDLKSWTVTEVLGISCLKYMKDKIYGLKGNQIGVSEDGISFNFTTISVDIGDFIYIPSKNLFVGVGTDLATSTDGTSWTQRTNPSNVIFNKVLYSSWLDLIIAVGQNGKIITSSNGIDWTEQTSGISENLTQIVCKDEYIVVKGVSKYLTSIDGVNWTIIDYAVTQIDTNGRYFICLKGGNEIGFSTYPEDFTPLIKYNGFVSDMTIAYLRQYGKKIFAYGTTGSSQYIYKTENNWNSWDRVRLVNGESSYFDYIYIPSSNLFIYCSGTKIYTSQDMNTWTEYNTGENLFSITYSEEQNKFVVVGASHIWISTNGTTWTSHTVSELGRSICWSKNFQKYFMPVVITDVYLQDYLSVYSSTDAINWTLEKDFGKISFGGIQKIIADGDTVAFTGSNYLFYIRKGRYWLQVKMNSITSLFQRLSIKDNIIYYLGSNKNVFIITMDNSIIEKDFSQVVRSSYSVLKTNELYLSGYGYIGEVITGDKENYINKLTPKSDMQLGLKTGENKLMFSSTNGIAILKYRQKYIGV